MAENRVKLNGIEIKRLELQILRYFSNFCKMFDLSYSLCYGTLLGAERHKGFIPWDDDIDVMMPRADYDRLLSLSDKFDSSFVLLSHSTPSYYYPFLKICLKNTLSVMDCSKTKHGIWIDVFPIDVISSNKNKQNKTLSKAVFLRRVIVAYTNNFSNLKKNLSYYAKLILKFCGMLLGIKNVQKKLIALSVKDDKLETGFVSSISWGYGKKEVYPKRFFDNYEKILFEGFYFFAIKERKSYLEMLYGDFMTLPPEEKRITHNLNAYLLDIGFNELNEKLDILNCKEE